MIYVCVLCILLSVFPLWQISVPFICGHSNSHYARWYMSNGMIHVQRSFREFARAFNKFWLVESWFLDTRSYKVIWQQIHRTVEQFSTNQTPGEKKARWTKLKTDWNIYKDIQRNHQTTCRNARNSYVREMVTAITIHVIFSCTQIGRSAIFGREIGIPDRDIFSRQKYSILV